MPNEMRLDPVTRYVRSLSEPYWLPREAAEILGISENRLRSLGKKHPDTLGPGHCGWLGEMRINLYDDQDLEDLRAYFVHRRATRRSMGADPYNYGRGRPPIWSAAESMDRHRRQVNARYHRRKADQLEHAGHLERAASHRAKARDVSDRLRAEHRQRHDELDAHSSWQSATDQNS